MATELNVKLPYVKRDTHGEIPDHAQMFSHLPEFLDTLPVRVRNVRETVQKFSISSSGFQYAKFQAPGGIDYLDNEDLKAKYYPALEAFMKEQLGAKEVRAFHHKVRNDTYEKGMVYSRLHSCPARRPHVDVTSNFAPILFGWDLPDLYAATLESGAHWQMINAWRPLKTIKKSPVVVCDTASVQWEDYMAVPQPEVGPDVDGYWLQRPTENVEGKGHEWWYMGEQEPDDVLLFLQHDSEGRQVVPHTSVDLPGPVPEEARESVEVRLVVIY